MNPPTSTDPSVTNEGSVISSPAVSASDLRGRQARERPKVQWNRAGETIDNEKKKAVFELPSDESSEEEDAGDQQAVPLARSPTLVPKHKHSKDADLSLEEHTKSEQPTAANTLQVPPAGTGRSASPSSIRKQHPILKKINLKEDTDYDTNQKSLDEENSQRWSAGEDQIVVAAGKAFSEQSARQRAARLERTVASRSAPVTRESSPLRRSPIPTIIHSPPRTPPASPPLQPRAPDLDLSGYPLEKFQTRRQFGIPGGDRDSGDEANGNAPNAKNTRNSIKSKASAFGAAARRLVQDPMGRESRRRGSSSPDESILRSGQTTPVADRDPDDYVPRPKQYQEGVLASLMKLYNEQGVGAAINSFPSMHDLNSLRKNPHQSMFFSASSTPAGSPIGSPTSSGSASPAGSTPQSKPPKWYKNTRHHSTGSIGELINSSTSLAQPAGSQATKGVRPKKRQRPLSSQAVDTILGRSAIPSRPRPEDAIRIHMHVADVLQRKAYLLKICRALMAYGAPTHRLEEYMRMSARVLEIDSQFLYMPGCMIVSFGDAAWHTTDVRLVRCVQAVNLSKLYDAHAVYKEVVHDMIGAEEAVHRLDKISSRPNKISPWMLVIVYGLASVCVGPFAFGARPIDLPISFLLGAILGYMQLILAPQSDLYANIFEISAAVLTSFLARAFGSIAQGKYFCFSALAQSAIALILPGYSVLCGSLELQSKNIVAGSVRMVYAIIYSLFLGFGITVGTAIYGAIDSNATSATTCSTTWPFWWNVIFVPPFAACLIIINQGKWKKSPPMVFLAIVGYLVNHFSAIRFASNAQIAQTLGALAIGVMGNLYSRIRHGLAAAILLPAIFVQVPSGLAASGSLISGVSSANQITNHTNSGGGVGTAVGSGNGSVADGASTITTNGMTSGVELNTAVLNVAFSMIQIAIGITVGLFMSALVVYPLGKRRSGLFSF